MMIFTDPISPNGGLQFRTPDGSLSEAEASVVEEYGEKAVQRRIFLCTACGNPITTDIARISVGGSHLHVFTNPAGFVFRVALFSEAPGCVHAGIPTREHTWFSGFAWSYALCAQCGSHLGWIYSSGNGSFFGLIADRLVEKAMDS